MAKVMLVKPALEIDAVFDPIRTCSYLGIWYMASLLKSKGHEVIYLDEAVRDGGLDQRSLFVRELANGQITETPLNLSFEEFEAAKMADFTSMTPRAFVRKYSAFPGGKIRRTIARIGQSEESTLTKIRAFGPDVVGIPLIASANYLPATRLARRIKAEFPSVKIVFGGQHISADPEAFLKANPEEVDQVVVGDAISVIEDIVTGTIIDRIVYGGYKEMDDYPLLDPEIIAGTNYPMIPNHTPPAGGHKWVDFMVTRGCFRKCSFCVAGCTPGCHLSIRAYADLDRQLHILKDAGYQELVIQDDAFLVTSKLVKTHLPAILSLFKKHGFTWQSNGGIDFESLTDWVVDQIIASGTCTALYIPFNPRTWNVEESASHSMIVKYHANLENLRRLRQSGVFIFTSAIIGTPEMDIETYEDELETDKALVKEGYLDLALPLSATMLPGTIWFRENGHNIVRKDDWPGYSLFATHHKTEYFSARQIEELMVRWYQEMSSVQENPVWGCAFPSEVSQ